MRQRVPGELGGMQGEPAQADQAEEAAALGLGALGLAAPQPGRLVACSSGSPLARGRKVHKAIGSQARSARAGSVIRVCSNAKTPDFWS
ncbi:MAG TPA: hypothetical protein VNL71_19675 [Chloroflexota bacterium]|nr:hypothetical protein [Chloroflexota bacterium]